MGAATRIVLSATLLVVTMPYKNFDASDPAYQPYEKAKQPAHATEGSPPSVVAESEGAQEGDEGGGFTQTPLTLVLPTAGGAKCKGDVDCGWLDTHALVNQRLDLPSGNGAKCLVGQCVCASEFEDKYGCKNCNLRLKPYFSYSDLMFQVSSRVRSGLGEHFDMCDIETGGAPCKVGICQRNSENNTVSCPGDTECDAAGAESGVCVGRDGSEGRCVCAEGYFCSDCSLHEQDILEGLQCEKYISGGALCDSHTDCSTNSYCEVPEGPITPDNRPFCNCEPGWTCRRCERHVTEMRRQNASCMCDAPIIKPNGGKFKKQRIEVSITAPPWDSIDECEVFYMVQRIQYIPALPLWANNEEALKVIETKGIRQRRDEKGVELPVILEYSGMTPDGEPVVPDKNGKKPTEMFYVFAVTVPRPNTSWRVKRSRLIRSQAFMMDATVSDHQRSLTVLVFSLLLALGC